jgi:hypothetical protein
MKNKAINVLNYTGIVTLSRYVGTKKIKVAQVHNTGGTSLFNFLANCLAGEFDVAKVNIPTKIRLLYRSGDTDNYTYSPITSSIFLRTPPEPSFTTGESRVKFSFIIPRDYLDSISLVSTPDNTLCLGLYANSVSEEDSENFMAFCELENLDQSILVNAYLVVDWELIIANSTPATNS